MPQAIAALQRAAYSADPDAVQGVVDIWERIRDAIPPGHPRYAVCQAAAGAALQIRFGRTGDPADLDAAIRAHQAAVDAAGGQAAFGAQLGAALRQRFLLNGSRQDLDAAITLTEAAVRAARPGDPDLAACQTNLGLMLLDRFGQTGSLPDIGAAVGACQAAVRGTVRRRSRPGQPPRQPRARAPGPVQGDWRSGGPGRGHRRDPDLGGRHACRAPGPPEFLSNLGIPATGQVLAHRGSRRTWTPLSMPSAPRRNATPAGDPDRAAMLSNLGMALQARFERNGVLADLDAG